MFCWYWYASMIALFLTPVLALTQHVDTDISFKYIDDYTDFRTNWIGDIGLYESIEIDATPNLRQTSGNDSGSNLICRQSDVAFGQWEFSVTFDGFQTSNQNYAAIWIQRESLDSLHGILVRVGENGTSKRIRLLASDPTGATTELLASGTPLPPDLSTIHVRLTRTPTSRWSLQYQFNTSGEWHSDQVNHPADLLVQSLFCISTRFTPTRADKFRFGPITTSTHATFLAHYTTPAPDSLLLHFSKLLPSSLPSVHIDEYSGSISTSIHRNTLSLRFSPPPGGGNRRLVVSNLYDPETSVSPLTISHYIQWFDTPQPLDLVINEFTPRPASTADAFIELLNTSNKYLDISDWTIGRSSASRTLSHSRPIAPGDMVIIQRNPPPDPGSGPTHLIEASIFPLGLTTDRLFIRDSDGQLIDSVSYSSPHSTTWTLFRSVEKKSPTYAGMDPLNWKQHPDSNTMGQENTAYENNFFQVSPQISLIIEDGSLVIMSDRYLRWDANSSISSGTFEFILPEWNPFNSATFAIPLPSEITLHSQAIHVSLDRFMSYDGSLSISAKLEVAQPPSLGDLILNEILYQPLQDRYAGHADQSEFIEIRNLKPWKISLKEVLIRDPIDKNGQFSAISPEKPVNWVVNGSGYALLVPDTSLSIQNSRIARFFALEPDASWGHVRRSGLSLSTSGKPVILSMKDGTALDSVFYGPEMHHPLLREQRGISLERVTSGTGSVQPYWTSSAHPLGATPGFTNSVSISEKDAELTTGLNFHPNPFSPNMDGIDDVVEIRLSTENIDRFSRITIYDINGRRIKTLLNDGLSGFHTRVIWDGTDDRGMLCGTGIYVVQAESYDHVTQKTRKYKKPLVLVRMR